MFTNRIRIDGKLTARSNLHLGSGLTTSRPGLKITEGKRKGDDPEIAAVAVDHQDRPYLPGTSLKGVLRAWLEEHGLAGAIAQLFGFEDKDRKSSAGGKAEFHDAFIDDAAQPATTGVNAPYWCPKRRTGVTASVAIDRYTRTASDKRLFHREYVPPGVTFDVTITGQDLDDDEIALLLLALRAFAAGDPVTLGSDTADGWGRFTWESETLRVLDPAGLPTWLASKKSGYEGLPPASDVVRTEIDATVLSLQKRYGGRNDSTIPIALSIEFSGPFLINDPSRTRTDDEPTKPNHAPRVDAEDRPLLPPSALRGVLRARAERIARTLGVECCDPNSPSACQLQLRPDEEPAEALQQLCVPCRLFGAPGWASRIGFSPVTLANRPQAFHQELVAIDRFTGGVAGSAKFNAEAFWQPHYNVTLRVDAQNDPASLGLLALALRDLQEGHLTLGFGAAKGYGACTATIGWPDAGRRDAAIAALRSLATPEKQLSSEAADSAPAVALTPPPPCGGDAFFNPYHFVPSKRGRRDTDVSMDDFKAKAVDRIGHARSAEGTLSGRILCRLKTESPVVIGGEHEEQKGDYTKVHPFRVPSAGSEQKDGEVALPATTLRGLLSSVAEAASNSALRVLEDESYSYRCATNQSLQAIGEIVDGATRIRPLTSLTRNGAAPQKSYVDEYQEVPRAQPPRLEVKPGSFLATADLKSWSADNRNEFWYARLGRSGKLQAPPVSEAEWKKTGSSTEYTRGILRILGIADRESEIPTKKAHEIFIPYPKDIEKTAALDAATAIEEFHKLAKERTESQKRQLAKVTGPKRQRMAIPFSVKGSNRNASLKDDGDNLRLRDGDLVFFQLSADSKTVDRLAVSAIWRDRVNGSTYEFFEKISSELLPFNPARKWLTIAEQMFGFVESKKSKQTAGASDKQDDSTGLALAGRVVVSFGRLADPQACVLHDEKKLKILSSPKPPSPNMYFRRDGTPAYIAKKDLGLRGHTPQGRKFYLHGRGSGEPWVTALPDAEKDQKAIVRPIREGTAFYFHIDFENLSEAELGLLCYALAPSPDFRHKLGMGKPLGLGTAAIETAAIFLTACRSRYASDGAAAPKYHRKWLAGIETPAVWPDRYNVERNCAADSAVPSDGKSAAHRASSFRSTMDADIRRALELLGDPRFVTDSVHTPCAGPDVEEKTYEWFGQNDRSKRQFLIPLTAESTSLPPLYGGFDQPYPRGERPRTPPPKPMTVDEKPAEPIVKAAEPLPPIAPAVHAGETRTIRLRVRCEQRNGNTFFVVEDPRLGTLRRAARGTEGSLKKDLGGAPGRDAEVTLEADVALRWRIGMIKIV